MNTSFRLFWILLLLTVLLAGCGGSGAATGVEESPAQDEFLLPTPELMPADQAPPPIRCDEKVWYNVVPYTGATPREYKTNVQYEWRLQSDGTWITYLIDSEIWHEQTNDVNRMIDTFNIEMVKLFNAGGFIPAPAYSRATEIPAHNPPSHYPGCDENINRVDATFTLPTVAEHEGYKTSLKIGNDVLVTVTSPGGSSVIYTLPGKLFQDIDKYAFEGGEAPNLTPTFEEHPITTTAQLEEIVHAGQNQQATIEFVFAGGDFEGRRILLPMLAKALATTASQMHVPVLATMHGSLSPEEKVVTVVTAELDSPIVHTSSWWKEPRGSAQLERSYSTWSNLTGGEIYIYPIAR